MGRFLPTPALLVALLLALGSFGAAPAWSEHARSEAWSRADRHSHFHELVDLVRQKYVTAPDEQAMAAGLREGFAAWAETHGFQVGRGPEGVTIQTLDGNGFDWADAPAAAGFDLSRRFGEALVFLSRKAPGADREAAYRAAINGMLAGLDSHCRYIPREKYLRLRSTASGKFGGLGIKVTLGPNGLTVVAPLEDTPADRAGLKAGDVIRAIDGKSVAGLNLTEAVDRLRGRVGDRVVLTLFRKGADKVFEVPLVRALIKIRSVKWRLLGGGVGVIRITHFNVNAYRRVKEGLAEMSAQAGGKGLKGLVLDLRNNPGGLLDQGVRTAGIFLRGERVVYTRSRSRDREMAFDATREDLLEGRPLAVLINRGSASAAEIVAGALGDHRRAVLAGERSFGKGSVQTIIPLSDGGAARLTTGHYITPSGRSIERESGIPPHVALSPANGPALLEAVVNAVREPGVGDFKTLEEALKRSAAPTP